MPSYNHVVLIGHLTRDPEVRFTPKGTAIAQIGLAVNRKWKTEDGQEMEEVSFFDCVAFNRTAEVMGQYLKKGKPVLIDGRLKQESWDDKQTGQKKYAVKIIINSFQFLESAPSGPEDGTARPARPARKPATAAAPADDSGGGYAPSNEDDVPF